ncbi:MAG: peptidoglycan DD-metalloendopeptidase family protein [Syntrophomonadaceae bacterium]|nr:peptidoglycan DD-metalloendopeptidase family protein [Syntrophomonadaceae bacterium]MDD3888657.1 peptidoglycan DD-metalloendopeptidase family protein [Syntrophomonadaceae bacterium]MDD4548528.1 peptidoglycan DD-metalloendopeptidase family protein [Syntrophomonadaceae bacterium]
MLDYVRQNKQVSIGAAVIFVFALVLIWLVGIKTPAYTVVIDGKEKYTIKNQGEVKKIIAEIEKQSEKKTRSDLELNTKVEYRRTFASRNSIMKSEQLKNELQKDVRFLANATAIQVNGKTVACVKSKAIADKLLEDLKKEYGQVDENEKLVEVSFAEDVKITEKKVDTKDIISEEKARDLITIGTDNPERYIVKEGDSLWLIARRNDMYVDDILKVNRLQTDKLSLDQELILVKSKPYINVLAKVEGEKIEEIPFETKVVVDKNSPTRVRVKQAGQNGEKHIVYVASKINGITEEREIKEETIIKEAVTKILVKGTQVTQVASRGGGSGSLDWPVYGTITQYYKSGHSGLDIGGRNGTPIRAADSGYVTFAGYQGNYGRFIVIDHGNGIVTRYAHCSSLNASVGQKVARGATIAKMGSTGRSSGPHLHFEVLANGSFRNPLNYLR